MPDYFDIMDSQRENEMLIKEHAQLGYVAEKRVDLYLAASLFGLFVVAIVAALIFI